MIDYNRDTLQMLSVHGIIQSAKAVESQAVAIRPDAVPLPGLPLACVCSQQKLSGPDGTQSQRSGSVTT